jgi:NAD-dependent dihydropyrimidine dehydrogenase PreA subunit
MTSACAVQSGSERTHTHSPLTVGQERCAVAYVIAQPCIGVKDNSCVEVCPVDCIHSTDEADQYFINPDECIDCGVCAEVCPVEAIFFEDDLPEQWAQFKLINAEFFKNR